MNHEITIDRDRSVAFVRLQGAISLEGLERYLADLHGQPDWHPRVAVLADVRSIELRLFRADDLRSFAESYTKQSPNEPGVRSAVLTSSKLTYGLARMWQALVHSELRDLKICATVAEAEEWLGLPPGSAPY